MIRLEPKLGHGDRLVVASHNPGKVREIDDLVAPFGIEAIPAVALNLPEPEETGATFEANARLKALAAAEASRLPALADDSGFCVAALGGRPGVHSARYAGPAKDFADAMARLNEELGSRADRRASFVCVLALSLPDGQCQTFHGEVIGQAVWPPRGDRGFGYDPMFQADGHDLTFGEMAPEAKHAISHRAHAFRRFVDTCIRA